MRKTKLFATTIAALLLAGSIGTASANPLEEFCERSPRDGKARWYPILCE
jgi:hypothetical protein